MKPNNNIQFNERTQNMIKTILSLRDELDKEYAATPEREYISDAYDDASLALTELTENILKLGSYNLRLSLSL